MDGAADAIEQLTAAVSKLESRIAAEMRFIEQLSEERHPILYEFANKQLAELSDALRQKHQDLASLKERFQLRPADLFEALVARRGREVLDSR